MSCAVCPLVSMTMPRVTAAGGVDETGDFSPGGQF